MGGKKKGPAKKKGAAQVEEDLSIEQFFKFYKRKCAELDIDMCPTIREKQDLFLEE